MIEYTQNENFVAVAKQKIPNGCITHKKLPGLIVFWTLTIFLLIIPQAIAHNLWLNVSNHFPEPGETVKVYLGWGHHYPFSDFLPPDRLESMRIILPDGAVKALTPKKEEPGTVINAKENGVYVVGAAMKPGYYTKTVNGHTFKSKKESKEVISSVWYEKYAKAIFCMGNASGNNCRKALGHTLEIIPLNEPCALKAGDYLTVRVLMRGKPLAGTFVYASCLGGLGDQGLGCPVKTNEKGEARIQFATDGIWRLNVKHQEPPPDPTLCDHRKYTAFLTVAVRE